MREVASLFAKLGIDPMDGSLMIDAGALARQYHPAVNVCRPLLIGNLSDRSLASTVKQTLLTAYPANHEVIIVYRLEDTDASFNRLPLSALDEFSVFDDMTDLYVPSLETGHDFTDLQETIAHLRAPEGCPWDREQTLMSLRQDLLSEAVEVMEAIDLDGEGKDNGAHIAEELGDVMLVVMMMVQIATDEGRFRLADVMRHIVSKLIRRHPHVFGDVTVAGADDVTVNWDAIKVQEKAAKGESIDSPLDGIPVYLPSLEKARELQSKAAKAGLLDRSELAQSLPQLTQLLGLEPDERTVGELLWVLTALAREHGIVAENALRSYAVTYRSQQ